MSLTALKALAMAKNYTKDTIEGAGAVAGKPCQIQSITDITGGKRVTFLWVDNSNVEHTSTMDVKDGEDGKGIKTVTVNANNHLIITYTDDTTYDAGEVKITAKVNSVNGKTGNVTLSTSDLNNDSDFVSDSNYVHTDNNYNNAAKALVDGMTAALAEKADADDVIDGASYDSTNHQILFKNGTTTLFSLDAAAFVKDGMVDDVEIVDGNLVITFNTDAGKQAISIPLTDIFDPANYYDKDDVDGLLADKADQAEVNDIVNVYGAKNLIPYPYLNESGIEFRGVTYTVNADRSITANGTATGGDSAFFILQRNFDNDFLSRIGQGKFILSGCPAGGSLQTYYLNFNYGDAQSSVGNLGQDTGNGKEITIDTDITQYNAQISVLIREGITVSNLTFKPMLRMASIKDNTYVPYAKTNKELTDEKVSYEYLGEVGSKNILPYPYADTTNTHTGITFTDNGDGTIIANGTATAPAPFVYARLSDLSLKGSYILSDNLVGSRTTYCHKIDFRSGGKSGTLLDTVYSLDGEETKFTIPSNADYMVVYFVVAEGQAVSNLLVKPMIRRAEDSDATWQPYAMTNKELTDRVIQSVESITLDNSTTSAGSVKLYRYGNLRVLTGYFNPTVAGTSGENAHIADLPSSADYPQFDIAGLCGRGAGSSTVESKISNIIVRASGSVTFQGKDLGENMFFNITWVVA